MDTKDLGLWAQDPSTRLKAARGLDEGTKELLRQRVLSKSYFPGDWPFGMPTCINPWLLIIGVSPGAGEDDGRVKRTGERPTIGEPNPSFGAGASWDCDYWEKVRALCSGVIGSVNGRMDERDCISISGHLNLGLRNAGESGEATIDSDVASWVSRVIEETLKPRVVVGFGLRGLLRGQKLPSAWKDVPSFSAIVNTPPEQESLASHPRYRFRVWNLANADFGPRWFVLWPNHPSRHPFRDKEGAAWKKSIAQFSQILQRLIGH